MNIHSQDIAQFQHKIWDFYKKQGRSLPWRKTNNPYHILVSEIMLQQTQVARVIPKYESFISTFQSMKALADANPISVLSQWQGLGYNRRAFYLQKTVQQIETRYHGSIPQQKELLLTLPGIGVNTAGSLLAFVYNIPVVFIETNIRRVFIHYFFSDKKKVSDSCILEYVKQTLDTSNPREWYYALMDYGSMLGITLRNNPNRRSKQYVKQSSFIGSRRQLRGLILKTLLVKHMILKKSLPNLFPDHKQWLPAVIAQMEKEKFIHSTRFTIRLATRFSQ